EGKAARRSYSFFGLVGLMLEDCPACAVIKGDATEHAVSHYHRDAPPGTEGHPAHRHVATGKCASVGAYNLLRSRASSLAGTGWHFKLRTPPLQRKGTEFLRASDKIFELGLGPAKLPASEAQSGRYRHL